MINRRRWMLTWLFLECRRMGDYSAIVTHHVVTARNRGLPWVLA